MGPGALNGHLLGRPVLEVGEAGVAAYLDGATVLVTGAGGSVGTELCTRLAGLGAHRLVLVDQAEAALLELAEALWDRGFNGAVPVLADMRNAARAAEVFETHRPEVVFHASAYKQVPLLEAHPVEAAANNVLATKHVVDAARRVGVDRFVLFSTDKAVQPTSVLGQTKAVAEWIVASAGAERYACIRLGNVVDSSGSMVPLFRRQLARGGPLTVTHPETTRYLMSAGEAAALAVVAGALADSNSVFWLDVGPPVLVAELARRLAQAESSDVAVEFVGLRPGERLHELPFRPGDEIERTSCERVVKSTLERVDSAWLEGRLAVLARCVERSSGPGVVAALADMHGADVLPSAVVAG